MPSSLYGNYRTNSFTEIYSKYEDFKGEYNESVFKDAITESNLKLLYYLLYARYGNSHIANSDENQFKYKLFSIIWQFGPVWEKKLDVQEHVRSLTLDELREGSRQISDHSFNPSTELNSSGEIDTVNEQDRVHYKKSKMDAYAYLLEMLDANLTEEFIAKFKPLFLVITEPQKPLLYGGM